VSENADGSPLVLKIAVPPSSVTAMIAELLRFDANCTIQAQAGNGIVYARLSQFENADLTRVLVGKLRPAALLSGGSVVVVASKLEGLTSHMIWGGRTEATMLMERIKQQFDPHNILNPGRFIL
jgi:glycolate oxidase FAD binding subunit